MTGRLRAETRLRAGLTRSGALHHLMLLWRHRMDHGGTSLVNRRRRIASQRTIARAAGVSTVWYGELERGQRDRGHSDEVLEKIANALRLDEHERHAVYLLLDRQPVPTSLRENPINDPIPRRFVDRHSDPMFIIDRVWNVLYANRATHDLFPHIAREPNLIRWALTDELARAQLVDWHTVWVPGILALLRGAHAQWPDDDELANLIVDTLMENSYAQHLWNTTADVRIHPDGIQCRIRNPTGTVVHHVEVMANPVRRGEGLQVVTFAPLDDRPVTKEGEASWHDE